MNTVDKHPERCDKDAGPLNNTGNVMLVDDDPLVRDFTAHTIEYGTNRSVTTFDNGFLAWRYFEKKHHDINLVITDANIPDMDGLELLKRIKERFPAKTVIVMGAEPNTEIKARQMGADAFISKPFSAEDLFVVARRFSFSQRMQTENIPCVRSTCMSGRQESP